MKFYGNGLVWNPEENKTLCEFTKGELETDDESICSKLIARGYKHEPIIEAINDNSDATFQSEEEIFIKEDLPFSEAVKQEVTKEDLPFTPEITKPEKPKIHKKPIKKITKK